MSSVLLAQPGAVEATGPDDGVAWHYGDPVAEQRALEAGTAVVDQSHLGVVTVTGPDRLTWLHSITSQQLSDLPPFTSTETLVLSPHGHIEHVAAVVDDGATTWLLTETAPDLVTWLDSMRFMRRVEVADVTEDWAALGEPIDAEGDAEGPTTWRDPWPLTAPGGAAYGPADADHPSRPWRLTLVPRAALAEEVAARQAAGARLAGTWASEALRIAAWRPRSTEVDHRTIPHELDWLRTAVHLAKGCYRGQETVARVHNLGRPPRRLVLLHLDGSGHGIPDPGAEVTAGERVVGSVTSVARHHVLGPIALAVIRRGVPVDDDLLVAADDGAVAAAQEIVVRPDHAPAVGRPPQVARGLRPPTRQ